MFISLLMKRVYKMILMKASYNQHTANFKDILFWRLPRLGEIPWEEPSYEDSPRHLIGRYLRKVLALSSSSSSIISKSAGVWDFQLWGLYSSLLPVTQGYGLISFEKSRSTQTSFMNPRPTKSWKKGILMNNPRRFGTDYFWEGILWPGILQCIMVYWLRYRT